MVDVVDVEKFRNIRYEKRTRCMVCEEPSPKPVIRLPDFPLTEIYTRELVTETEKAGFVDQEFVLCRNCGHGQILNIISPELLYGDTYYFRTSVSKTAVPAVDFFLDFVKGVLKNRHFNQIADIGSSDLYMLKQLTSMGNKLIGIDPVLKGHEGETSDSKIVAIGELFEDAVRKHKLSFDADLVLSSHTFEHIKDPKAVVKSLLDNATDRTYFAFQFPGLESLVNDARFDQVFHQHYNYFTLKSVIHMLTELGAELIAFKVNPYHWGALMFVFKKRTSGSPDPYVKFKGSIVQLSSGEVLKQYALFKDSMSITRRRLEAFRKETVYGYGAALMLPVLNYHLLNAVASLNCIIDDDEKKEGLRYINLPVSIKTPKNIADLEESVILITAVDNVRLLLPKVIAMRPKKIILPHNKI